MKRFAFVSLMSLVMPLVAFAGPIAIDTSRLRDLVSCLRDLRDPVCRCKSEVRRNYPDCSDRRKETRCEAWEFVDYRLELMTCELSGLRTEDPRHANNLDGDGLTNDGEGEDDESRDCRESAEEDRDECFDECREEYESRRGRVLCRVGCFNRYEGRLEVCIAHNIGAGS